MGWRYTSSVLIDDASPDEDLGVPANIEGPGGHKVNDTYENPAFNYIDLAVSVNFARHLQWVLGINNIFDEEPPIGAQLNRNDYGPGWYGYYDPWGRMIHTSLQFNF
jgi:outer membrane receptor protein involved in Fe transport